MEHKKRGDLGKEKKSKSNKKKKASRRASEIRLRRAKSGELIAHHSYDDKEPGLGSEEHVVPDGGLDAHVAEHMPMEQPEASPSPQPGNLMGAM